MILDQSLHVDLLRSWGISQNMKLMPKLIAPSASNWALNFNGTNQYCYLPDGLMDPSGMSALTIAGWLRSDVPHMNNGIAGWYDGTDNLFWIQSEFTNYLGGEGLGVVVGDGTALGAVHVEITSAFFHFAMVYDGSLSGNSNRLKLYYNGNLQTLTFHPSANIPSTVPTLATSEFRIGDIGNGALNRYWDGPIESIGIWNWAFSAGEVNRLMNGTSYHEFPNSMAWYRFQHLDSMISGKDNRDWSGNGNDLIMAGYADKAAAFENIGVIH